MYTKNVFAAGALLSVVAAVPMAKRDIVWVTETDEAVVTVPVTQTVWVNPGETPAHYGHHHGHSTVTSHVQSTVHITLTSSPPVETSSSAESSSSYVAPSSSETPTTSSTSEYVAPTTSSTSEYVAPTTSSTSIYVAPTTSSTSVYVAPTTSSTSVYVAPTTSSTSVYVAPTTSTSAAPAATSSSSAPAGYGSGLGASGTSYTGDLTYFATGLGACGWVNTDSEPIVAISHIIFDSYSAEMAGDPNKNPLCGKYVTITGEDGSPYQAKVVDRCPSCDEGSLDLTQTLFDAVEPTGNGRVHNVSWKFD